MSLLCFLHVPFFKAGLFCLCWSIWVLGLSWGLVLVHFFWTLFSVASGLLGGGDWFSVWVLFLLLPPVHLAASWAARVAVSVWCLAMVVFTVPVRVEFSALVRLWWVVGSRISWSRTFWCLRKFCLHLVGEVVKGQFYQVDAGIEQDLFPLFFYSRCFV